VAWKINLARFKSELQRERKKLSQWYFEASSINYHRQQNDPPRVREISKLQTQFEMQHMAILHDIDKRVKPQPEQASSSSDEYDSEQDEEAVNSSSNEEKVNGPSTEVPKPAGYDQDATNQ
jgi:hypothetical protein